MNLYIRYINEKMVLIVFMKLNYVINMIIFCRKLWLRVLISLLLVNIFIKLYGEYVFLVNFCWKFRFEGVRGGKNFEE